LSANNKCSKGEVPYPTPEIYEAGGKNNKKKNKSLQAGFNCCQQLLQKAGLTGSLKLTGVPLVLIL